MESTKNVRNEPLRSNNILATLSEYLILILRMQCNTRM